MMSSQCLEILVLILFHPQHKVPLLFVQFCSHNAHLKEFPLNIQSNARRYASLFAEAAEELLPERTHRVEQDSFGVLLQQVST